MAEAEAAEPGKKTGGRDYKKLWRDSIRSVIIFNFRERLGLLRRRKPIVVVFHILFTISLYFCVTYMLPIGQLGRTTHGLESFIGTVGFERSDGTEGTIENVATLDDVVYFSQALVQQLLEHRSYRGERQPDEKLMLLRVHRLVNSIAIVQRRVEMTHCASSFRSKVLPKDCFEGLDVHELEQGSAPMALHGGDEVSYDERLGGFGVELPLDRKGAAKQFKKLRNGLFWDRATRESTVRFAFHNSPGHFTGSIAVTFSISPYGHISHEVHSSFLRLRPYSPQVNGGTVLTLQISMLVVAAFLICSIFRDFYMQPHKRWRVAYLFKMWTVIELTMWALFLYAGWCWIKYLNSPTRTSFQFDKPRFQDGFLKLAELFNTMVFVLAATIIFATLRTIEYLGHVGIPAIHKTSEVFETVIFGLASTLPMFVVIIGGFTLAAQILFGPREPWFTTVGGSAKTLLLWFVTLEDGQRELMQRPWGTLFMVLFILMVMVLLFNVFIAAVLSGHADEMGSSEWEKGTPWNHKLADKVCDFFGVEKFRGDPYGEIAENFWKDRDVAKLQNVAWHALAATKSKSSSGAKDPR